MALFMLSIGSSSQMIVTGVSQLFCREEGNHSVSEWRRRSISDNQSFRHSHSHSLTHSLTLIIIKCIDRAIENALQISSQVDCQVCDISSWTVNNALTVAPRKHFLFSLTRRETSPLDKSHSQLHTSHWCFIRHRLITDHHTRNGQYTNTCNTFIQKRHLEPEK